MSTIYHQFIIKSDIQKVFDAISKPEELIHWWPLKCSGRIELGCEYNFNFTDKYDWFAKVTTLDSPHQIEYKMTQADVDWNPTSVGFYLEANDGKVLVNFYHKDWQFENDHFKIASFCWAMLLNGLKNYVEKNVVVPFEERA